MARFLFAATPAAGHVNPALPIMRALTDAGHDLLLTTGPDYAAAAAAAGARFAAEVLETLAATGRPVVRQGT